VLKEYILRKDGEFFRGYCSKMNESLESFKDKVNQLKKNICYKFEFNTTVREDEIT
jgi:hypothetical protein